MSPERWRRVREIFDAAVERKDAEEFARTQCGSDAEMYSEIRRMLQEHARTGFMDKPPGVPCVFFDGQTVAGRYRIVRYLGRGGMGEVYEAQDLDLELKEHVALKTLLPAIAADESMVGRFKQEIALSRKIQHPNICGAFDLARHESPPSEPILFLTMPFLEGETLAQKLQRDGPMSTEEAMPLVVQMAEALGAAHRAGVIHRDFKPSNVMLAPSAAGTRAVVADFGLARSVVTPVESTATLSAKVVGTLDYMAPELLTGSMATCSSDVYALGMTVYKMVTRVLPFAGDTPLAAAILRSKKAVPTPRSIVPNLSAKWERAILGALEVNPARRFSSTTQFLQALRGDPVSMTVRLPVMSRRRWVGVVAATAVLAATLVGWRTWESARHRPSPEAERLYRIGVDDIHAGASFAASKALSEATRLAPGFSLAHARLAEADLDLDLQEKASIEMQLARRGDPSALSKVERLQIDAIDLIITRDFGPAIAKYEEIGKITAGSDPQLDMDLARAYERGQKPEQAAALYRKSATGPQHNPAAWLRLAIYYSRNSKGPDDDRKSDEAFERAEQIYQQSSNLEGITETIFQKGAVASRRGKFEISNGFLKQAIDTARLAHNLHEEIRARLQLANNAYVEGDGGTAERQAREALDMAVANQMEGLAVAGIVNLGSASFRKHDYSTAEKYYSNALELAQRNNSLRFVALAQLLLASLHDQMGQPDKVATEAAAAISYFESHHWMDETVNGLTLLGRARASQGDYEGAFNTSLKLYNAAEKAHNTRQMTAASEGLGEALSGQELLPKALERYRDMLRLSTEPEKTGYAALHCGVLSCELGSFGDGEHFFVEAERQAGKFPLLRTGIQRGRIECANERGAFADGVRIGRQLAEDSTQNAVSMMRNQRLLGLALLGAGHLGEARRYLEHALQSALTGSFGAWDVLAARLAASEGRLRTGDRAGALSLFRDAETALAARPESKWRALALMSMVDRQYADSADRALSELKSLWGDPAFQGYRKRYDVQQLSRPLLKSFSAEK